MKRTLHPILAVASLGFALALQASAAGAAKPNVLFLFSDQHNADVLGCAGHPIAKTPNLDRLAADGVRFTRTYCQDGICVPSRTSLMTGLYPRTTGCLDNGDVPPSQAKLYPLQQAFQSAGYATGCFGKRHLPRPNLSGNPAYATIETQLRAHLADWVRRTPDAGKATLASVPVQTKGQNKKSKQ